MPVTASVPIILTITAHDPDGPAEVYGDDVLPKLYGPEALVANVDF